MHNTISMLNKGVQQAYASAHQIKHLLFDGTINKLEEISLATSISTNDVYTYGQMLKQIDKAQFIIAMQK